MMFDLARGFPTLATDRLRLRQLTEADTPALFARYSDPVVMRYTNRLPMASSGKASSGNAASWVTRSPIP